MKKIRKHIIIAMLVLVFSLPLSLVSKTLFAASYPIPSVSASQLTSHRGNQVTGDDIVNTGAYLAGLAGELAQEELNDISMKELEEMIEARQNGEENENDPFSFY